MSRMKPASFTTIAAGTTDVVALAAVAGRRLLGYSVREGAGSTATATLRHGENEAQTVTFSNVSAAGGTFTLTYSGQTTAALDFDATAAEVEAALIALSNIGALDVTCSGGPLPDDGIVCTFAGDLALADVAAMTGTGTNLTGADSPYTIAVSSAYTGTEFAYVSLASGGTHYVSFGDRGLDVPNGVFLERVTGNMCMTLYWTTSN